MNDSIKIRGARQHNLKNINVDIPKNKLVVFTGISGSGKSSLAFDTIYAEGQHRYVESLSAYARQFLGVMDKPDVDLLEGLSPAISIDQKSTSHNPRSTVGTITEIYDYLRLLFARVGHPHCPVCGREISRQTVVHIVDAIIELLEKEKGSKPTRFFILSPIVRDRKGEFSALFDNLRAKGFTRVRIDGKLFSLQEELVLLKTNKHSIDVVIDRLTVEKQTLTELQQRQKFRTRVTEAIEHALNLSNGLVMLSFVLDASFTFPDKPTSMVDHMYSQRFACPVCNISLPEIEPRIFSFNSPHGACSTCSGIGTRLTVDPNLVLNRNLSIDEGGILPFARLILSDTWFGRILLTVAQSLKIQTNRPLKETTPEQQQQLLFGTGDKVFEVRGENRSGKVVSIFEPFSGIIPELTRRLKETDSEFVKREIGKYFREEMCPTCKGKRLKEQALSVTIDKKTIVDVSNYSIRDIAQWVADTQKKFSEKEKIIAKLIVREIAARLSFLLSVGLEYLTLARGATSLSGGEAQRIRLASQIGSGLSGVLYVLDEPSIGLHPRDNQKLIATLKSLRDLGNSVIVVEHDREMMEKSDMIFDFGPGAGRHGGNIIAAGTLAELKKNPASGTGLYLSHKKSIHLQTTPETPKKFLLLRECRENNLKDITVSFPLQRLVCVTGVSGSGKSTLVVDTLFHALAFSLNPYHRKKPGAYTSIAGLEHVKRVILIDQTPIGRTPRSNPATYTGAFTFIRDLFAQTPEARARGYQQGRFSFNVRGGRCEACMGEGQMKIEMQFLPDVYVQCDVCNGKRFNAETLEIRFKEKNIAEILEMTVEEALAFFAHIPGLATKLETLYQVGLSYIHLGQPAPHLSGGEAQRIKLAAELAKRNMKDTVFILDEPTTGLHFADIEKLLFVLRQLVAMGNTVIVIEHNVDVMKNADWIIDLGPEGGDRGGTIIAEGTPKKIHDDKQSYTGHALRHVHE